MNDLDLCLEVVSRSSQPSESETVRDRGLVPKDHVITVRSAILATAWLFMLCYFVILYKTWVRNSDTVTN